MKHKKNWGRILEIAIPSVIISALIICFILPSISCLGVSVEEIDNFFSAFGKIILYCLALAIVLTIVMVIVLFKTEWGNECLTDMFHKIEEDE